MTQRNWNEWSRTDMGNRIELLEDAYDLAADKIVAQEKRIDELEAHLAAARKLAADRNADLEASRFTMKAVAVFVFVALAALGAFGMARIHDLRSELDYYEEPYSEEQFMNDVFGSAHDPVKCGEVLCSVCEDRIVCYDGGICPVGDFQHRLTMCDTEHEVE